MAQDEATDDSEWVRFEVPDEGDLFAVTYEKDYGGCNTAEGIVTNIEEQDDGTLHVETTAFSTEGVYVAFDPDAQDDYGELRGFSGGPTDIWATKVLAPVSQVENPGIEPGDSVKVRMGDMTYTVESVEDGRVTMTDGMSVPVSHITAFDEDTDAAPFETFWDHVGTDDSNDRPAHPTYPGDPDREDQ